MPVTVNHRQELQAHFNWSLCICTNRGFGTGESCMNDTATGRQSNASDGIKYFQKEIGRKKKKRRRGRPTHFYIAETGSEEVLDDAVDREADRASDAALQVHQGLPAPPRVMPPGPEDV